MIEALVFPAIDPVAFSVGPLVVRWYALAYIAGLLGGWRLAVALARKTPCGVTPDHIDDFLTWATAGVILGGRIGYVLFYNPGYYLGHPLESLALWRGGMSFHGGFLGVVAAAFLFARRRGIEGLALGDLAVTVAPIGLGLGRIANFINGELFGRIAPADFPLAMVFPGGGPWPRHPSQLYQAAMEGVLLLVVMLLAWRRIEVRSRPGFLCGVFLIGYGCARMVGELFRQPDAQIGFLVGGITMGQLLSLPMLLAGAWLIRRALRRPAARTE